MGWLSAVVALVDIVPGTIDDRRLSDVLYEFGTGRLLYHYDVRLQHSTAHTVQ
jgi:hypothetical protein